MEEPSAVHLLSNSVCEDTSFELIRHRLDCKTSCAQDQQFTCNNMLKNVESKVQQISCYSIAKNDQVIGEIVGADGTCHLQSSHVQLAENDPTFEADKVPTSEDVTAFKKLISSDARLQKCLNKSATFPSSEEESLPLIYSDISEIYAERNGASRSTEIVVQKLSVDQIPTFKRSISLPALSELISAMKGGRARSGVQPKTNMHIKWAEGVHDPPATSLSHTVKSHSTTPRSRPRKKDGNPKHKHSSKGSKSSSSRGNGATKRLQSRGIASASSGSSSLQVGGVVKGSAQSGKYVHDVNCGSIFLWESLAKVHLSFGEAT